DSEVSQSANGQLMSVRKQEVTYRIDKLTPGPNGGQDATIAVLNDGKPTETSVWRVDPTGIYQVGSGKTSPTPITPPHLMVPFPAKEGKRFTWTGEVVADTNAKAQVSLKSVVDGQEPVDTAIGSFNALAIHSDGTRILGSNKAQIASKLWLVPGKGIARI